MMDELLLRSEWMMLMSWSPMISILVLLAAAAAYLAAPALGYSAYHRGLLLGSVWMLIAKIGLTVLKSGILLLAALDAKSSGGGALSGPGAGSGKFADNEVVTVLFFMLDSGLLVLALALFAGGLASLRRDSDLRPTARSFSRD
jgi:hypothetical protein